MIDPTGSIGFQSELQLFDIPSTSVDVERTFWETVRPMNTITDDGPYEFFVVGNNHYIDMSSNFIYLKLKIVDSNGKHITGQEIIKNVTSDTKSPDKFIAVNNLIGSTFFKQVKMIVNGRLIYDSGQDYAHLVYMLTDLNNNTATKQSILQAAGWYTDCTPDFVGTGDTLNTWNNPGAQQRHNQHINSRSVEYMSALLVPFARQTRYLLNHLDIRFELHRVSDAFALQTIQHVKYKIVVEDIKLYIRKIELARDFSMAIEKILQYKPAKYPVRRTELKTFHLGYGRRVTPTNALWNGQLPRRVFICTLPNKNYFGGFDKNPFVFQPNKIMKVCLYVNGACVPYNGPLETTFYKDATAGTSLISRAFTQLYTTIGNLNNESNGIDLHRFNRDACYFAFDLSADNICDSGNWELLRTGTLSIYMEFEESMNDDGLRVLILGEFDNLITIDRLRQIQYDYAV